jgi:hypothetical protein
MKIENGVVATLSILHFQFSILNLSLQFTYAYIESLRAEGIEREADNAVDQTILFIQQCRRELDAVAWRYELVLPWFARLLYQRAVAILDYQGCAP